MQREDIFTVYDGACVQKRSHLPHLYSVTEKECSINYRKSDDDETLERHLSLSVTSTLCCKSFIL